MSDANEFPIRDDIDTKWTDDCVCPWCGYEDQDSWELGESDDNHECGRCERQFSFTTEVTRTFTTIRKGPA